MAAKKIIGYLLSGIGIVGLALSSFGTVRDIIPISPSLATSPLFFYASAGIALIGIIFLVLNGKSSKQAPEVPIYDKDGKSIVGYRRMKK
jgi:hypothetical protein